MIYILALLMFIAGLLAGSILFADSRPRKPLTVHICHEGWNINEIAGLFASVLVQKFPGLIPKVLLETDKTIVFEHPRPKHKIHYMFVPKKDIKNIGELAEEDKDHLIDLFSSIAVTIDKLGIVNYRICSNGPGKQDVAYLHFHLWAD